MNRKVSVIIPTYNEEKDIEKCAQSLLNQSYQPLEIIVVDDGSGDRTLKIVKKLPVKFLEQKHLGPGIARNRGARHARGEILVFVDADMIFARDFVKFLVKPILEGKTIGTFSKEEYVANKDNIWSKCWNTNRGVPPDRMHSVDYPDHQPVFRALLKKEFERVGGFDPIGYTDDWTLSRKLGVKATVAPGAVFYHKNPASLGEVWKQARWIGKNEFITGSFIRRLWSLWVYGFPNSLFKTIRIAIFKRLPVFLVFKPFYDLAVLTSVVKSFLGEQKAK